MYNQNIPFIQNPFNQLPVIPSVNVPPGYENVLYLAAAHLINIIQNKSNLNPIRGYYHAVCAHQNYNNETFTRATRHLMDWIKKDAYNNNVTDPNIIINTQGLMESLADQVVSMQASATADQDFSFKATLPPELINLLQQGVYSYQNNKNLLANMPAPPETYQQPYPQQQFPQHNTTQSQLVSQQWTMVNHPAPQQNNLGRLAVGTQSTRPPVNTTPARSQVPINRGGVMESFGETSVVERPKTIARESFHPHTVTAQSQPVQAPTAVVEPPSPTLEQVTEEMVEKKVIQLGDYVAISVSLDPERPYDYLVTEDDTHIQPAHLSSWDRTPNKEEPYSPLVNLKKHVKFHVRKGEHVSDLIVELTPDMEYLNHELKSVNGHSTLANEKKERILTNWDLISKMHVLPQGDEVIVIEGNDEICDLREVVDPITHNDIIIANTLEEAELRFHAELFKRDILRDTESAYEFYVKLVTPIPLQTDETEEALNAIKMYSSLLRVSEMLYKSFDNGNITFWESINKRFTDEVNKTLNHKLSLSGWDIDSFVNDYKDLLMVLKKDYGEELILLLENQSRTIINTVCNQLTEEEVLQYCKQKLSVEDDNEILAFAKRFIFFNETISVTFLPWTLSDFDMSLSEVPELIKQSENPQLHNAVMSICGRAKGIANGFNHHYLLTKDRKLVEVHKGYLTSNAYLANLVSI